MILKCLGCSLSVPHSNPYLMYPQQLVVRTVEHHIVITANLQFHSIENCGKKLKTCIAYHLVSYCVMPCHAIPCIPCQVMSSYRQVSNISRTYVGKKIVYHSDRRCSNYIFILDLTHGFIRLGKDNCMTKREKFKFGNLVRVILETLRYIL